MTLSTFAVKLTLLALVAQPLAALAEEPRTTAGAERARAQSADARDELNDATPIVGRKLVKLNRPVAATREYTPFDPKAAIVENENKDAASRDDQSNGELEAIGREIVDFRFQSGQGRYMMEDENGMLRVFPQSAIESVEDAPDTTLGDLRAKVTSELQREFGATFWTHATSRYLFVSDTSEGYVKWCARLFDDLDEAFEKYARKRRVPLTERVEPLIVVIFAKRADFIKYASVETTHPEVLSAYYNIQTNRVALYDLSQVEGTQDVGSRRKKSTISETREFLSRPNAAYTVATIVHEATHQLAFNRGVFKRSGPIALWAVEGLSLVVETPSASLRQNGWVYRGAFPTNERMKSIYDARSVATKITFKDVVAQDAYYADIETSYAFSWALFYYLERKRPGDLASYLRLLQEKPECSVYSKEERIADFEACFGDNWEKLEKNIQTFMRRL